MVERERERQLEREQREREQREREREREQREREQREQREREQRDRQQRERDRERLAHQEEEERRRKHYEMINERMERPMEPGMGMRPSSEGPLTAANLIDAIITHQINQTASEPPLPPSRDLHRASYYPSRDHRPSPISENNGKSHSPNVINIDVDSEPTRKNITLGELTETIITKDYTPAPNPYLPMRPMMMDPSMIPASEAWKYRRMPPSKEDQSPHGQPPQSPSQQQVQLQVQQSQGPPGHQYVQPGNKGPGRSTPDDRHIIRMAQSPGPRNKFHESVSPDTQFFHPAAPLTRSRDFALDCYVKSRIVEAMRTEDDKRADDGRDHQSPRNPSPAQHGHGPPPQSHHNKDHDRSTTPGDMLIDDETGRPASGGNPHRPPSSSQQMPPHSQPQGGMHNSLHSSPYLGSQSGPPPATTFAPPTYYPYSALTVSGGPVVGNLGPPGPPTKTTLIVPTLGGAGGSSGHPPSNSGGGDMNDDRQSSSNAPIEPKPLLSAKYEALSDED